MSVRRTAVALLVSAALLAGCGNGSTSADSEATTTPTAGDGPTDSPSDLQGNSESNSESNGQGGKPEVVATMASGLAVPWGLDFLPDGRAVVTERDTARVLVITPPEGPGEGDVVEVGRVPETAPAGEAGLLGVAVSPDFQRDHLLYFYVCTADDNQVVRAELDGDRLGATEAILTGIPNGAIHDGG